MIRWKAYTSHEDFEDNPEVHYVKFFREDGDPVLAIVRPVLVEKKTSGRVVREYEAQIKPRGRLFRFMPDGTLMRCENIDPAFGLDLDSRGRMVENR